MHIRPLVIGLSGVTSGGKSTVAKLLANHFPGSEVMCQDHYFKLENQEGMEFIEELGHYNWDRMSAIDMAKFEVDFHQKLASLSIPEKHEQRKLLVLEGFLLLNYKPIADLVDIKYHFILDYEECWARRQTRNYDPPDVPGYFQQVVWPMYLKHKKELFEMYSDVKIVDGKLSITECLKNILNDVNNRHEQLGRVSQSP